MKAVVGAFNQEKALVGAFSVITNLRMELFEALVSSQSRLTWASSGRLVSTATLAARFSCGEMNSSGLRELPALATAGLGSRPDNIAIGGRLMYNNNLEDLKGSKYYMRSGPQTNKLC